MRGPWPAPSVRLLRGLNQAPKRTRRRPAATQFSRPAEGHNRAQKTFTPHLGRDPLTRRNMSVGGDSFKRQTERMDRSSACTAPPPNAWVRPRLFEPPIVLILGGLGPVEL